MIKAQNDWRGGGLKWQCSAIAAFPGINSYSQGGGGGAENARLENARTD